MKHVLLAEKHVTRHKNDESIDPQIRQQANSVSLKLCGIASLWLHDSPTEREQRLITLKLQKVKSNKCQRGQYMRTGVIQV